MGIIQLINVPNGKTYFKLKNEMQTFDIKLKMNTGKTFKTKKNGVISVIRGNQEQ